MNCIRGYQNAMSQSRDVSASEPAGQWDRVAARLMLASGYIQRCQ